MVLYATLKSDGKIMDLTNIEGIERLECITLFTEVASKLSGNLHLFCTQLCKGKKKFGNVTVKNYLNESLLSLLCFIIYGQGSFDRKGFDVNCQKFI